MNFLRKIIRKIRFRPIGIIKRTLQRASYVVVAFLGKLILTCLRALRLIEPLAAYEKNKVKKILVLRPDRIGDVILATPVLEALRNHFPHAHIALLVSDQNRDLVAANPFVNEIITIGHKGIWGIFRNNKLLKKLKKERFDLALVLYPVLWCNLLVFLSSIPYRLGHDFHGNGFLLTTRVPYTCEKESRHEVDVNLQVLEAIGIKPKRKRLHVSVSQEAEKHIASFLYENNISPQDLVVVIHPGAYEQHIRWMSDGFAKVAWRLIDEHDAKVVILGGPGEEGLVDKVCGLAGEKTIPATGLMLSETISLIKRAGLFLGNSTGPMHIAAALEVPVVAIFGNIHPLDSFKKWGPYGGKHIIVHKDVGCRQCQPSDCSHFRCMKAITADEVFAACQAQIKRMQG
ncbi:MAG: glycosyltransferase family 9 protein [Candidatus Omnitrophica bacterium]|nr:glycosyltransferase family 9 protein [Candidatus Omnitrophota bacterium]